MLRLIQNTLIYSIGELVPRLLSFILLPIYTHYLTPADYGVLNYVNSIFVFLPILSTLSLSSYLLRFFSEQGSNHDKKLLVGNIFLFIALFNCVVVGIAFFYMPSVFNYFKVQIPWDPFFKLSLITFFLDIFSIVPLAYLRVNQKAKIFVFFSVGKVLLQYIIILLFIVRFEMGLMAYFYGNLIASIPFFIIALIIILKNSTLNLNFKQIQNGLKFSLPLVPSAIAYLVLGFSDRILLERYVSLAEIGIYSLAYTLSFSLNILILSFYKAIEPEIFVNFGNIDFGTYIKRVKSNFYPIIFFAGFLIALFSQEFFFILAPISYYNGYLYVPIIVIGVIITGQNVVLNGILIAQKNTSTVGIATLIGVIVNISINLIFIPKIGVYSAALAMAISFLCMNSILFNKVRFKGKSIIQEFLAMLGLVILLSFYFYFGKSEISLVSILIKCSLVFFYFLFLINVYDTDVKFYFKLISNLKTLKK